MTPRVRFPLASLALACALATSPTAEVHAQLTYGGDPGGDGAYASRTNGGGLDQIVFDNFRVSGGRIWSVTGFYGHFYAALLANPTVLNWEIRTGMVVYNNTGTVVASGSGAATYAGNLFMISAPLTLTAGDYWLGIWADLTGANRNGGTFWGPWSSSGVNAVNAIGDGRAISLLGPEVNRPDPYPSNIGFDISYGINGTETNAVPEPRSIVLIITGLAGLGFVRRRSFKLVL